ncbi:phospholipid/cholesterol/gamma-HCH transport system substrate-binding protein [Prauserella shujinwangii]|uniref:Phospholipid/cholesterol/gamma-HCH transport system substrate-binding protein n=1 Tax=Prauserella shujinwangii TaxID=1453103 RepID=A0A2T0LPY8_9PSEU|nr:MCE family protein [Prauserella shujinwangii]PRX45417.1 phospholipid/cholesterol/gamma-HCH transport system substrate-binding protein [Prauserella shujinwangii]
MIRATVAKLLAFTAVCATSAVLVVNTLTDPLPGPTATYHAVFTDAQGLRPGSRVTVAGVRVGKVTDLSLVDGRAHVTFAVRTDQRVPAEGLAVIRYADLLGSRYLALTEGTGELPPGATIPVERTRPALDLTALFNGFKPLFDAIDPDEVNRLAEEIVAVFQGEATSIDGLLSKVVSLTTTLGGRDEVIGQVLDNLTKVLDTMNSHREDLRGLVTSLAELTGFAADTRHQIAGALDSGAELAGSLTRLLGDIGPGLTEDVRRLGSVTRTLTGNQREFEATMREFPPFARTLNRTLDYGSWVNVYVCDLAVDLGGEPVGLGTGPHSEVCR